MHWHGCYVLLYIIVSEAMHSATSYRPCIWPVISISGLPLMLSVATATKDLLLCLLIPVSCAMIIYFFVFFLMKIPFAGHYTAQICLFILLYCITLYYKKKRKKNNNKMSSSMGSVADTKVTAAS